MTDRRTRGVLALLGLALVLGLAWWSQQATDDPPRPGQVTYTGTYDQLPEADPGTDTVALGVLPPEARAVVRAIHDGGPFGYSRDGITFGNREGLLPPRPRGYYREYTVPTPGESDRGARRIVVGENGAMYYTEDHYASFRRIEE